MRDRLIELMLNAPQIPCIKGGQATGKMYQTFQNIADHLLANGVIVPPCKVGDTVYVVDKVRSGHWEQDKYIIDDEGEWKIYEKQFNLVLYAVGGYYLTKEEAEEKLKEREQV